MHVVRTKEKTICCTFVFIATLNTLKACLNSTLIKSH